MEKQEKSPEYSDIQYWIDSGYLPDPDNPSQIQYLYNKGDELTAVSGGWEGSSLNSGVVQKLAGSLYIKGPSGGQKGGIFYTVKKINLKRYNKLVLVHSNTTNDGNYFNISLGETSIVNKEVQTFSKKMEEFDISAYNSENSIKIQVKTGGAIGGDTHFEYNLYEAYLYE